MAEPCWILTYPSGDTVKIGDGDLPYGDVPHFPTEKVAAELADGYRRPGLGTPTPRRLDRPCVIVSCSCCEYVLDEEEDGVLHFPDLEEAETTAPDYGWRRGTDGSWLCGYCAAGPCDLEADTHG